MSEKLIAEGIQTIIQSITGIDAASVSLSDWSLQDSPVTGSPFVRIDVSEDFESVQDAPSYENTWNIPVTLLVEFVDWETSMLNFRNIRQSIIDKFNEPGTNRSAGGIDGVDIKSIKSISNIEHIYREYNDWEDNLADPIFLAQLIIFEVSELNA